MSTTPASPSQLHADEGELIPLEPTEAHPAPAADHESSRRTRMPALVHGGAESLTTETDQLRRNRLLATAAYLSVLYGVFFFWNLATRSRDQALIPISFAVRTAIALLVVGVAASRVWLSGAAIRRVEYAFFAALTLMHCLTQYLVILGFARAGEGLAALAYSKNGVVLLLALMVLYGMLIPNRAKTAAAVILSMALAHFATMILLKDHPEVAELFVSMKTANPGGAEQAGTDLLLILMGAALAIYGAHLLNHLRTELHGARRLGQYQLGEMLGSGGMGEVYLAEHHLLKRPCALKLIRPDSALNPIALARFEREVQSAAKLSHPNTIEIFDYGHSDNGTFYYVMEYLPGMSLQDLVRKFGPLEPGRVIYLSRQVCGGLAEAHELGIVHRDLKPGNIHVALRGGESDVAKVLDFGLVKLTQDPEAPQLTADRTVSGTPLFMSPEQARGEREIDPGSDIYSLGAVMYFMLTGEPPFTGENAMEIMIAHARDPVKPPRELRSEIPQDLEAIVLRALAKARTDRFESVRAMAKALAECAAAGDWNAEKADSWWAEAAIAEERRAREAAAETFRVGAGPAGLGS